MGQVEEPAGRCTALDAFRPVGGIEDASWLLLQCRRQQSNRVSIVSAVNSLLSAVVLCLAGQLLGDG